MPLYLRVESCPLEASAKGQVFLDPKAMEANGLKSDDLVEIVTGFGKGVIGRVAEPLAQDRGLEYIRMDQYFRQAIKAVVGDPVGVEKISIPPLQKAVLAPLMDVARIRGLEQYLVRHFSSLAIPVSRRSILYANFPGATSGSPFRVVECSPESGVFTEDTVIEVRHMFAPSPAAMAEVTFEDVGGLHKEIQLVRELVELPILFPEAFRQLGINPPRGIILYGPPGTGKTHLTRAIANELQAEFFYINGPEVVGTRYGETESNLRKVFEEASRQMPSIIFVDELDAITPKRGESGTQTDVRMSSQFLELLDGLKRVEGVMVIGTTNRIDAVDPAMRRPGRFDREIFIGPPDVGGRLEILKIHTRGMPLSKEARDGLRETAQETHGFVGADLMEVCREAGLNCLRRQLGDQRSSLARLEISLNDLIVEKEDFRNAIAKIRPSALRETVTTVPDVRWEDIGGLEEVKETLRELVEKPLAEPEVFVSLGMKPPTGILLYGPPGTGKTLLAKAIANECNANFISISGPEIFSKWVGESEEAVRHIFQVAHQVAPAIVFFDQLDALAPKRSGVDVGARSAERVVSQLLAELDGIEPLSGIIVIGATNRFDLLDPAILRPGRFGLHILVPSPTEEERRKILRIHLRKTPLAPSVNLEALLETLIARTGGFAGADLEALCFEAKLLALRAAGFRSRPEVAVEHFLQALERVSQARAAYATGPMLSV